MAMPDLNLLVTLDVLLAEGNVARAARRLHLSPSAMSRALARLRKATGDPLLVRAGRGLVPTPRADELRERVRALVDEGAAVLRPETLMNPRELERTFTLRAQEGFVENFGPALLARLEAEAPGVRLRFAPKPDKESALLREGSVDLETGVLGPSAAPELRVGFLFRDRFVGVVRTGHPLVSDGGAEITVERYAAGRHVAASRRDNERGPIDVALEAAGAERKIATIVASNSTAVALARGTDLIATVPERHTGTQREGMHTFPLPFPVPEITLSLFWHPRLDADPAHRWLRDRVREVCGSAP